MVGEYRLRASFTLTAGQDDVVVLCARGDALLRVQDYAGAAGCYRAALKLRPGLAEAHHQLGEAQYRLGDLDAAMACFRQALALAPGHHEIRRNIGHLLERQGRLEEAQAAYEAAALLRPDDPALIGQIFYLKQRMCDWGSHAADRARLEAAALTGARELPWMMRGLGPSPAVELAVARRGAGALAGTARLPPAPARAPGRLRVGYLSSDFRNHPVGRLLAPVIAAHDRDGFELFGYSHGEDDGGAERAALAAGFEHFVELRPLDDAAAAARIRADGIDLLIDLNGFTEGERPGILARRPAPVQASWLGYTGTLGCDWIDYVIADGFALPFDRQAFYDERIVHLPGSFVPVDPRPVAAPPDRAALGLPATGFVFCCHSNAYKITPAMFDVWMRLLVAVRWSVLWLYAPQAEAQVNLRREAVARGVDSRRLVFAAGLGIAGYRARMGAADLFLDTSPYSAGTVAGDALAAGLPLLTLAGETFASRHAGSLLHAMGRDDLIVDTLAAYEARALELAAGGRPARVRVGALADARAFARGLERVFREIGAASDVAGPS